MIRSSLLALGVGLTLASSPLLAQQFLGKNADVWAQQLNSSTDARQRRHAAFALGKMKAAAKVLPEMTKAYAREQDPKVRDAILFAMGDICRFAGDLGNEETLEKFFIAGLSDSDPYVRRSAAYALGCQGTRTKTALAALDAALSDMSAVVRQNAAWALVSFKADALSALRKALTDSDSLVKRDAASAVSLIGDGDKAHELLNELLPLCKDANSEVRRAALSVLVRIVDKDDKKAIPVLKWPLENDRDLENKRNAALAMSNIGGPETIDALPVLLEAIKNGDLQMRRQAVAAIYNIGPKAKDTVELLTHLLRDDPDVKIRRNAALSLGGIRKDAESAIPVMVGRIQDMREDTNVRGQCAVSMQAIGDVPAAKAALPALLKVMINPNDDGRARGFVAWALRVHGKNLRTMPNTLDTFATILKEPMTEGNRMLRYDCAYMLGRVWANEAPEIAVEVLKEYLLDPKVLVYEKTTSTVGPQTNEGPSGESKTKLDGDVDGRTMACDALESIGANRYSRRPEIMKQLNVLANDPDTQKKLRDLAGDLLKKAK